MCTYGSTGHGYLPTLSSDWLKLHALGNESLFAPIYILWHMTATVTR
jgi:hypothetical protein